jgi:isochorismate pyruvate lyase
MPKQTELPPGLAEIRAEIDRIDAEIVRMLTIRLSVVEKAAQLKHAMGVPFRDKEREEEIMVTASERAEELGLPKKPVRKIFRQIVRISTRTQGERE